ncbi:MAG: hypothetical protein CLLPBCKN_008036 [Chroococcidiopsis cubana SAG 39.79]|jgi:hypothetical protein|uniref:Uncharacterized protein n=2 Tax=Chroococcidiopsis TaxID=54298 RepID=K9U7Y5_CHRTP|nr:MULTISPECIES: hypothetical protein [Chroococcidiopsis]AFY90329.1 hypothetical protein Chro_4951 [Chroococcidiopsis thermalis PCC 7203]MDZ4878601.1 hypothetical protein [Chroococcidiopsis cubana SAG 39.79]RUT10884.1 hypothetical protein DSM107010_37710 [Chroococcidiopsis cubana SAG 39.79]URD49831.1 hypothetical protein M5J74_26435 [Chroococcidiopsis sp. CCNUC1]
MMKTSVLPTQKTKISLLLIESFKAIIEKLIQALTRSHELQVWRKKDRNGNAYWQAFDPKTRKSTSLSSEAEMRIWIEQRYYHSD